MSNSQNALTPAEGSGGVVDLHGRMEAAKAELAAMTQPEQAHKAEAEARAIAEIAATRSPAEAHAFHMHGAELSARAMRRFGELLPKARPGQRTEEPLQRDEEVGPPQVPALSAGAISARRAIASLALDVFEGAIAGARSSGVPITQSALLKLVPKPPKPDRQVGHLVWLGDFLEKAAKKIRKRLEGADGGPGPGTPEAMDTGEVASLIEELARRVDARREDPDSKQIDLSNLVGPPPDDDEGDEGDDDADDQDAGEKA